MFTETIKYSCDLEFDVYKDGVLVKSVKKSNILTDVGKLVILSRLCDPSPPYSHLNKMAFGNGTNVPTEIDTLQDLDFGDYVLSDTLGHKLNLNTEDSVEVYWELDESKYNGKTLTTVGLVSHANDPAYQNLVFNRVLFLEEDYIEKDPSTKLVGKWIIRLVQPT